MNKTIGILGCGWLGFPLALSFGTQGYSVKGSTTSIEKMQPLENAGITPFLLRLTEAGVEGDIAEFLLGLEVLVIDIPPRLRGKNREDYVKKMAGLSRAIEVSPVKNIIFVSSTSVYGDLDGEVNEQSVARPETESGKQLLAAEQLFKNDPTLQTTVVRFGGLIGPDRHPVTMLSGREGLMNGNEPINLIHLDDCIAIIRMIVQHNWWDETFNGVYPLHPKKKDYYQEEALKRGLQPPIYIGKDGKSGKTVQSHNLITVKKYRFMTTIVG